MQHGLREGKEPRSPGPSLPEMAGWGPCTNIPLGPQVFLQDKEQLYQKILRSLPAVIFDDLWVGKNKDGREGEKETDAVGGKEKRTEERSGWGRERREEKKEGTEGGRDGRKGKRKGERWDREGGRKEGREGGGGDIERNWDRFKPAGPLSSACGRDNATH